MKNLIILFMAFVWSLNVFADRRIHIDYGGDPLTEKERLQIERILDYQVDFYSLFGLEDSLRVKLTVFNERSEAMFYLDSLGVTKIIPLSTANGLYNSKEKEAVILEMGKDRKKGLSVIYHELSHFFTREITCTNPPMWLMEGFSEYFEHCEVRKKGIRHSMSSYEIGRIRTMYMLGEINLKKFVDSDRTLFMKKQRTDEQYSYILAHALVAFMVENVSHQILVNLISLLQDHADKSAMSEKIARIYPGGFDAFENDFAKLYNKP